MTTFKVDDIVSVDLSRRRGGGPRYDQRLIGVVIKIHTECPQLPPGEELAYGVPWDGPYPLTLVYIPSIVGGGGGGEDGRYWFTETHVSAGEVCLTNEELQAPTSKFSVGDRVALKQDDADLVSTDGVHWKGTVKALPTIKEAQVSVVWDGTTCWPLVQERNLIDLHEIETKRTTLLAVINDNEARINTKLEIAMNALLNADKIMARNGTRLRVYLGAKKDVCERLTKVVHDTIPNVIREDD